MSSFVVSDHTVLAIVEGMRRYGLIEKKNRPCKDMAEALRFMNEYMTACRYSKNSAVGLHAIESNHLEVTSKSRPFYDGEILAACNCWLYQVDTGDPMDFDFLTIFESVKLLRKKLISECKANKTLKVRCYFGDYKYFFLDPDVKDFVDMYERYGWDLCELPKAA